MSELRTHLALGRVSNLSTVWSNVLCAWIIVGGYSNLELAAFLIGASLLYTGGMYMNDFCDRDFDRAHRPERPIPSGRISERSVFTWMISYLIIGSLFIVWTGFLPSVFALLLIILITTYNVTHKRSVLSPVFMAGCRACLFLIVASSFEHGIDTYNLIAAGVAFTFVLGITYLARSESTDNRINYAALALIAGPVLAAFYYRAEHFDAYRAAVLVLIVAWLVAAFLRARVQGGLIIGKTIGPLLASIPLIDLLVLTTLGLAEQSHMLIFAAFFAIATTAQRVIPAT